MSDSIKISDVIHKYIPESIYDGLVVIDKEFNIVYANKHFLDIYGLPAQEFIGKKCSEVVCFDHCYNSCPHFNIINHKRDYSEHNLRSRRVESDPFCISASPVLDDDGNVLGVVELFRNMQQMGMYIGSLEDTNAALMLEKNRLLSTLDDISDGYYTALPDGTILSINDKLLKLFGKKSQDVIGKKCSDVLCAGDCSEDCPREWAIKNKKNVINAHHKMNIDNEMVPYDKSIIVVKNKHDEVEKIIGVISKVSEIMDLKLEAKGPVDYLDIITKNDYMRSILKIIEESAPTDAPILIKGETGTGKELFAKAIRKLSLRADKPFVKINCSALTESLLESELFGHVKGAFTGAYTNYDGKFKKANGGTIFLDEVENMSASLQAKLLRVLEEQEFEPVGSNRLEKVNVRIIAASNQDLLSLIDQGIFRSDLYYRLNVIKFTIPPLRERKEDIPVLIEHRLKYLKEKYGKKLNTVSARGMGVLLEYNWPGNIRQLFGALEYAFLRAKSERIERSDLPEEIFIGQPRLVKKPGKTHKIYRDDIIKLINQYPNNLRRVAFELGISRTTLWRKMQQLKIG